MKEIRKVENENKKNRGKVFTPTLLAEEMINTIPEIKINAKILDPCSGATNVFPIMMMFRYVKQFGKEHLSTHINECIQMCEMNPLAADFGEAILIRYFWMLKDTNLEIARQHNIDNCKTIINEY